MPNVTENIRDALIDHAHGLERFKNFEVKKIQSLLSLSEKEIKAHLADQPMTAWSENRYTKNLEAVKAIQRVYNGEIDKILASDLKALGRSEAEVVSKSITDEVGDVLGRVNMQVNIPSSTQLWAAANSNPLTMDGNTAVMMRPFTKSIGVNMLNKIEQGLRYSYAMGETPYEATKRLFGTATKKGSTTSGKHWADTVTRTSINHMSNEARQKTYEENDDIVKGYQWISTLDGKTTEICRYNDSRVWFDDEGRRVRTTSLLLDGPIRPPGHAGCRSTTIPILMSWEEMGIPIKELDPGERASINGTVPAAMTYYEWLAKQSGEVQKDVLGVTRYEAWKRGDITPSKFHAKDGRMFTLNQLRDRGFDVSRRRAEQSAPDVLKTTQIQGIQKKYPWITDEDINKLSILSPKVLDDMFTLPIQKFESKYRKDKKIMEAASKAKNTLRGWSDKNSGVIRDVEDDLFNGRTPEFEVDIEETKLLEHLIETGPKFHGVVSRGTETDLSDLKVGSNYETRAMSSFSEGASPPSEFADKALSVLIIPKSTRGISIRQFSANKMEEEVLVPKSKYRVKKIQKLKTSEGSVRGIILEEINE